MDTNLIEIGTGATYSVGSDRYPATVVAKTAKTVTVQSDDFRAGEGHNYFGAQNWICTPNPNRPKTVLRWSEKRQRWIGNGCAYHIGHRSAYQNPSL